MSDTQPTYSLCESVVAGPKSPWHIREVPAGLPLKFGGGIQTGSLCGHPKAGQGWDLQVEITEHHLTHNVCTKCVKLYREKIGGQSGTP